MGESSEGYAIYVCENGHPGRPHYPCIACGKPIERVDVVPVSEVRSAVEEWWAWAQRNGTGAGDEKLYATLHPDKVLHG